MKFDEAKKFSGRQVTFKTDAGQLDLDFPPGGVGLVWSVKPDLVVLEVTPYRPQHGWVKGTLRVPLSRLVSLEAVG
ncbi:MAG TPA: hypothetical protein VGZ00_04220 [Candidatus Baltobacteraceae bacterium]|jgi:hypothetical protein|nr:hypothetical protein [Candidatus Baltobacteraceae bacterium]